MTCSTLRTIAVKWNSDGRSFSEEKNQIFRHFNAKQSLSGQSVLTLDNVKRAHFILMENSIDTRNKPISNGEFRTTSCYSAGTWISYPPPRCIKRGLENILNDFNTIISTSITPPHAESQLSAVTNLFYDFVSLHPFQDGNGRMARILLSYGLERMGTPFPVVLSSGHSRSKSHVIGALRIKDRHYHNNGLYGIVASSLALQWQQFFNYVRFYSAD